LPASNKKKSTASFEALAADPHQSVAAYSGALAPIKDAYALVYQAAHILANHEQQTGAQVRETYLAWIAQMQKQKGSLGTLSEAIDHFVEKTANFAAFALSLL
jgi:hypothetical protein